MANEKEEKLSRIEEWRRKKQEKNRLKNLKYNEKNRKKRAEFARERRRQSKARVHQTRQQATQAANRLKRIQKTQQKKIDMDSKMEMKRQQTRERVKKCREKKKQMTDAGVLNNITNHDDTGFPNRMAASRAVRKVTTALPETPKKRSEIIQKIIASPRTRKHLVNAGTFKTPEEEKETRSLGAMATDVSEGLELVKKSGSIEKRAALRAFKSLAFGENVKKSRAQLSL